MIETVSPTRFCHHGGYVYGADDSNLVGRRCEEAPMAPFVLVQRRDLPAEVCEQLNIERSRCHGHTELRSDLAAGVIATSSDFALPAGAR